MWAKSKTNSEKNLRNPQKDMAIFLNMDHTKVNKRVGFETKWRFISHKRCVLKMKKVKEEHFA